MEEQRPDPGSVYITSLLSSRPPLGKFAPPTHSFFARTWVLKVGRANRFFVGGGGTSARRHATGLFTVCWLPLLEEIFHVVKYYLTRSRIPCQNFRVPQCTVKDYSDSLQKIPQNHFSLSHYFKLHLPLFLLPNIPFGFQQCFFLDRGTVKRQAYLFVFEVVVWASLTPCG